MNDWLSIAPLGETLLELSIIIAIAQCLMAFFRNGKWQQSYQPSMAICAAVLMFLSFGLLIYGFANSDFSLKLVAAHSHSQSPMLYKITASWGNHEGSMLLWCLILSLYGAFMAVKLRLTPQQRSIALSVMGVLQALFVGYLRLYSNPFEALFPPAFEGEGFNPLLQDFGLAIHPPILYAGYVGFASPFAISIAILWNKHEGNFAQVLHSYLMFAWTFLTAGIALGSWWAYRELGWGGWWFWDPVENVALLPWLTGTALFHANLVLRKTGNMPRYVLLLCLICFALSLIGTFLVRSGLLTSVHSFASDPTRGIVICVIMAIIITLAIVAYFRGAGRFEVVKISHFRSKEALILINNLLLLLAMAMIFLATFYPFVLEAINGSRITIGSSYFNEIFAYLMLPTVVACALSNFLVWGENKTAKNSRNKMLVISVESAIITGGASYFLHYVSIMLLLGLWCGIVLLLATGNIAAKLLYLRKLNITNIAVMLGHLGLGLFVICATVFGAFHQSAEFVMQIGDERTAFNDYAITLHNIDFGKGENYLWQRGEVRMLHNNQEIIFYPEERFYEAEQQFSNESAIKVFLTHDWYVTMKRINKVIDKKLDERKKQQYIINIYYNPLMLLLWLSVAMMIIAGIIACINVKKS